MTDVNSLMFPGFRGSVDANGFPVGQYPEIRGTGYVESGDPVQVRAEYLAKVFKSKIVIRPI